MSELRARTCLASSTPTARSRRPMTVSLAPASSLRAGRGRRARGASGRTAAGDPAVRPGSAQLRARARVSAGGVLHRGRAGQGAVRPDRRGGQRRRRGRARARPGIPQAAREKGGRTAALRLPGRDGEQQAVSQDRGRIRGSRSGGIQGPGAPDALEAVLTSALGIHTVEARHAAWMRYLNGNTPAADAFDLPRSRNEIDGIVASTHFITGRPRSTSNRAPRYMG